MFQFVLLFWLATFFLTGCSGARYHTQATGTTSAVFTPAVGQSFIWPVEGDVITRFGDRTDDGTSRGMVIRSGERGQIRAARDGRVEYVNESLRGYGKTVILGHPENFHTVYAGISESLVKPGQWVRRGEPIARTGSDGQGSVPRLYFEIRRNARPEDPSRHLQSKRVTQKLSKLWPRRFSSETRNEEEA